MSASKEKKQEKALIDRIKAVQKKNPANRKCADCGDVGPTYICLDFNTFVSTASAGIHREFNHRVKGITLSKWTEAEVQAIESAGGNEEDAAVYLARWDARECPMPDSSQQAKLKDFIRQKYEEQRWMDASALGGGGGGGRDDESDRSED